MLKDALEYLSKYTNEKPITITAISIPSKYAGLSPQIRGIQEYTKAFKKGVSECIN